MGRGLVRLLLLTALLSASGGCRLLDAMFDSDYEEPSCPPGDFPRCSAQGRLLECPDNYLLEQDCHSGLTCLEGFGVDGDKWALCVDPGAATCDPQTARATCADDGVGIWDCVAPGYTDLGRCRSDEQCLETLQGALCVDQDSRLCDPGSPEHLCDGERPARCDSDTGVLTLGDACGPVTVCVVGPERPVCVQPGSEPCDPSGFDEYCDGDVVIDCDWSTDFTEREPCAAGDRCRTSNYSAGCFGADQPDCDRDSFEERCAGDDLVTCNSFSVEEHVRCTGGRICRLSDSTAGCADPDAELCDSDSFVRRCEAGELVTCTSSGFTRLTACDADELCTTTPVGATCAAAGAEVCDPDTYAVSCDGTTRVVCNVWGLVQRMSCATPTICRQSSAGVFCVDPAALACDSPFETLRCEGNEVIYCGMSLFEEGYPCQPDTFCAEGDLRYLGWPVNAECVAEGTPTCDGSVPVACSGSDGVVCFGGSELTVPCGEGYLCLSDGQQWFCASDAMPTCDGVSFAPYCVQGEALRMCFGDPSREINFYCSSGVCVEDAAGARCQD